MTAATEQIEADIKKSRTALNDTLEQLGGKLSPGQVLDEAIGLAKGQAGQFTANLGRQVRDNPLPLVLIGAGIAMMVMNARKENEPRTGLNSALTDNERRYRDLATARSSVTRLSDETHESFSDRLHAAEAKALELTQHAGEAVDAFKERVKSVAGTVEETAASLARKAKDSVGAATDFVGQQASNLKDGVGTATQKAQAFYDAYPLAAGAIGLAVGALIGSSAPLTSVERDKLKGVADAAQDMAENAGEMVNKGTEKVAQAFH